MAQRSSLLFGRLFARPRQRTRLITASSAFVDRQAWTVRKAASADLDQILAIEADCAIGWTRSQFAEELLDSRGLELTKHVLLAERRENDSERSAGGVLVAWSVPGENQLLYLGVCQSFRRQGIASQLVSALFLFDDCAAGPLCLEVRATNVPARAFYRKLGFLESGSRKRYYKDDGGDAILLRLTSPAPKQLVPAA